MFNNKNILKFFLSRALPLMVEIVFVLVAIQSINASNEINNSNVFSSTNDKIYNLKMATKKVTETSDKKKTISPTQGNNSTDYIQKWESVPIRTVAQKTAGIQGGEGMQFVFGMSYTPSNPNVVYLVTNTSQVWKSLDGGFTWQMKHKGFSANGGSSLVVNPNNENIVFVAGGRMSHTTKINKNSINGVIRTLDGGENWELVKDVWIYDEGRDGDTDSLGKIVGGTQIVLSGERIVYVGTYKDGLWRSDEAGNKDSWYEIVGESGNVIFKDKTIADIKIHPTNPSVLYVSVVDDGLYKVEVKNNKTAFISKIGSDLPEGASPRALAVNPKKTNIMYVTLGEYGVYKSTDGGKTFKKSLDSSIDNKVKGKIADYISISAADPDYIYVHLTKNDLYYSHNGGKSWSPYASMDEKNKDGWICGSALLGAPCKGGGKVGPIATHPIDKNVAISLAWMNIIVKTTDGGKTWKWSSDGFTGGRAGAETNFSGSIPFAWDIKNKNRYIFFLTDYGPFITEDGGSTFRSLKPIAFNGSRSAHAGAIEPVPNSQIIVTAVGHKQQEIRITEDAGNTWREVKGTSVFKDENSKEQPAKYKFITFHPQNTKIIYSDYYTTKDKGRTWIQNSKRIVGIYSKNGNIVYGVDFSLEDKKKNIYKSRDQGLTWQLFRIIEDERIGQIIIDPIKEDKLYVARTGKGIYIIEGNSMILKNDVNGLEGDKNDNNSINVKLIAIDTVSPNVVYVGMASGLGNSNGIFRSTDYGNTWKNITYNLGPEFTVWGLSVNPHDRYVYVGSSHGTWKLPPP